MNHHYYHFNATGSESTIYNNSPRDILVYPEEQLNLTCVVNHSMILKWVITIPEGNITHSRLVPFMGSRVLTSINETLNDTASVTFSFMRASEEGTLPLISTLMIDGVHTDINGTEVYCLPSNETDPNVVFIIYVQGGRWSE